MCTVKIYLKDVNSINIKSIHYYYLIKRVSIAYFPKKVTFYNKSFNSNKNNS